MARIPDINITEGKIAYSNFSGSPTQYTPEGGKRSVTFVIPDDIADELIDEGWPVRKQEFDDGTSRYLLDAAFLFRTRNGQLRDPKIFIVRDNRLIHVLLKIKCRSIVTTIINYFYPAVFTFVFCKFRCNTVLIKYLAVFCGNKREGLGVLPFLRHGAEGSRVHVPRPFGYRQEHPFQAVESSLPRSGTAQ